MKKYIPEIMNELSSDELGLCVLECEQWNRTGILPDGELKKLAERLETEAGVDELSSRSIAENQVRRKASILWLKSVKSCAVCQFGPQNSKACNEGVCMHYSKWKLKL
jgi:hypothetical protein